MSISNLATPGLKSYQDLNVNDITCQTLTAQNVNIDTLSVVDITADDATIGLLRASPISANYFKVTYRLGPVDQTADIDWSSVVQVNGGAAGYNPTLVGSDVIFAEQGVYNITCKVAADPLVFFNNTQTLYIRFRNLPFTTQITLFATGPANAAFDSGQVQYTYSGDIIVGPNEIGNPFFMTGRILDGVVSDFLGDVTITRIK